MLSLVMSNYPEVFEFDVSQIGCVAARILDNCAGGRVISVFDHSFYIETDKGLICCATGAHGGSPLNFVAAVPENTNWRASGVRVNDKVIISTGKIRIGERFSFSFKDATEWKPDQIPVDWTDENLKSGLALFRKKCRVRVPQEGLGRFIFSDARTFDDPSICKSVEKPIEGLCDGLAASLREPERCIRSGLKLVFPLIGMGPGLTPSGDDFVGGMMIALHSLGEEKACQQLWKPVRQCVLDTKNPIAFAHLSAASEGLASAGIHRAIVTVMEGRTEIAERVLRDIDQIGHTSGWDAMAGVMKTFDLWLQAANRKTLW